MTRCECPSDCYYVHFQDFVTALLDDFKEGKAVVYKCTLQCKCFECTVIIVVRNCCPMTLV